MKNNTTWGNALDDRGNAPYTDMFNKTYGKNGGFILDDSSCDPYGVVKMRENIKRAEKNKTDNVAKKSKNAKKK